MLYCTEGAGQEYPYRTVRNSKRKDHLRMRCGSVSKISVMGRASSCFRAPWILPSVQLCRSGDQKSKCALLNLPSGSFGPVTNQALGSSQIFGLFVGKRNTKAHFGSAGKVIFHFASSFYVPKYLY